MKNFCSCGVPESRHGSVCGWHNAHVVYFPWENLVQANMSGEEKELRYLISTSPNQLKLSHFFTELLSNAAFSNIAKAQYTVNQQDTNEAPAIT